MNKLEIKIYFFSMLRSKKMRLFTTNQ